LGCLLKSCYRLCEIFGKCSAPSEWRLNLALKS